MEEDIHILADNNRKRKLRAEQLGIPSPKHACATRSLVLEIGSSMASLKADGCFRNIAKHDTDVMDKADCSDTESSKGSNSVAVDADSFMSTSGDAETDEAHSKECASDLPSTLSSNWHGCCSSNSLYSLESRSLIKSGCKDDDVIDHDFGLPITLNIDEHILDFGGDVVGCCSECNETCEGCGNKELQELFYSNGVTPKSFIISSGKMTIDHDNLQNMKKLTIDKEFEQYFSELML